MSSQTLFTAENPIWYVQLDTSVVLATLWSTNCLSVLHRVYAKNRKIASTQILILVWWLMCVASLLCAWGLRRRSTVGDGMGENRNKSAGMRKHGRVYTITAASPSPSLSRYLPSLSLPGALVILSLRL